MRRNRQMPWLRSLVAEHRLTTDDLVWPIFVHEGSEPEVPVASMPGVVRFSEARAVEAVREAADLGCDRPCAIRSAVDHRDARATACELPRTGGADAARRGRRRGQGDVARHLDG
jgi:delta-aminolevulinic acid dehydratase/porphobilinogen synthase